MLIYRASLLVFTCYCHILHKVYSKLLQWPRPSLTTQSECFLDVSWYSLFSGLFQSKIFQYAKSFGVKETGYTNHQLLCNIAGIRKHSDNLQQQIAIRVAVWLTPPSLEMCCKIHGRIWIFKVVLCGQEGKMQTNLDLGKSKPNAVITQGHQWAFYQTIIARHSPNFRLKTYNSAITS